MGWTLWNTRDTRRLRHGLSSTEESDVQSDDCSTLPFWVYSNKYRFLSSIISTLRLRFMLFTFYKHCSFTVIDKNDGKTEINTDPWGASLKKCMHWNTLVNHCCLGMCVQIAIYSPIHVIACLRFSVFHKVTVKCPVKRQILFVSEYFFLICPATCPVKKEMKFLWCNFSQWTRAGFMSSLLPHTKEVNIHVDRRVYLSLVGVSCSLILMSFPAS